MTEGCGEKVPFVSMIDVTADTVAKNLPESMRVRKAGILAGGGCVEAGLYQNALEKRGIEPVIPSDEMQALMQDIIYRIKAGDKETVIADFVSVLTELKVKEQS